MMRRSIEPEPRTLYRIVESNPPTERDMRSLAALGRRLRDQSPAAQRLARGVSLFDTAEQAALVAREAMRKPGAYIATLELPRGTFHIEQSGKPGHYTLFAEPDDILATVTDVRPVADIG